MAFLNLFAEWGRERGVAIIAEEMHDEGGVVGEDRATEVTEVPLPAMLTERQKTATLETASGTESEMVKSIGGKHQRSEGRKNAAPLAPGQPTKIRAVVTIFTRRGNSALLPEGTSCVQRQRDKGLTLVEGVAGGNF